MRILYYLLSVLVVMPLLGLCQLAVLPDTSFMQAYCTGNNAQIDGFFDQGKTPTRSTLSVPVLVYAHPHINAKVIDTLAPFSAIQYVQEGTDPLTATAWLKVAYRTAQQQSIEKLGYMITQPFSMGVAMGSNPSVNLEFVLGESPLLDADLQQPMFRLYAIQRPILKSEQTVKVSNYDLDLGAVKIYNHFYLSKVHNTALAAPNLLRLYWHRGESCPESEGQVFINYTKGKMSEIMLAGATGEGSFYEFTKVYLPLKFADGKILLVENGDSKNMFDPINANLKTIPYPADSGVPIDQLVVAIEEDAEGKTDAKGQFISNTDGSIVMEVTHRVVRYYRWTGESLVQVKKIVVKQKK